MASLFFSFLFSASMLYPQAQNNPKAPIPFLPDWTPGVVVLETNDTVACTLRYNQLVPEGLLQVFEGDNVLTLSVRDVKSFYFYDERSKRHRQFFSLPVPIEASVAREIFMEYLYGDDNVSILSHRTVGLAREYMEFTPFRQQVPITKLYIMEMETGDILPLSEENALSVVRKKNEVARFVDEQGIRFRKLPDYVKVFKYDQSL